MEKMCQTFNVSRSGYYQWRKRKPSLRERKDEFLKQEILTIYHRGRGNYGSPRIHRDLIKAGISCGRNRVERLMKELGIRAKHKKKFKVTTDSWHHYQVAENLLDRNFNPSGPNQCWVSDITYIYTKEGWLYLAAVMDLYSRRLIGWAMEKRLTKDLVIKALNMAIGCRHPVPGLLMHSDRGSQYASHEYQELLKKHGMRCSMSRKGNCYDNAVMESFFHTLKVELIYDNIFETRMQARRCIFEYIEVFYNRIRTHSSIGYKSPEDYEKRRKAA